MTGYAVISYKTENAELQRHKTTGAAVLRRESQLRRRAKVFDFIAESAEQKRMFVQWEDEWEREHIPDQRTEDAWNELIRKMKLKETEQKEKAE